MLLLASQSPRRAELLTQLNVSFTTINVDVDESTVTGESAEDYVRRLAIAKAMKGWEMSDQSLPVLGSDTAVVIEGHILGKPRDKADSARMLRMLSGKSHRVLTAVALVQDGTTLDELVATEVQFKELSDREIEQYWLTGEPQDKAGSYAIQGIAGHFVKQISGSYSAVVGLPLYETYELLEKLSGLKHQ